MQIRATALISAISALACSPVLVAVPAEAGTTCAGLAATITGTDGDDTRVGTPLRDVVALGGGNDSFDGLGGDDVICGGGGKDRLAGGVGNDRIYGGAGADYFIGDAGNDRIIGGRGRDYLSYHTTRSGIRVTNGNTIDGAGHDVVAVETIEGTAYADQMNGSRGADDFRGLVGKDQLKGGGGNDLLAATGGTIRGGAGNDFVDASGSVTAYLGSGTNGATIGAGNPTVVGGPQQDEFNFRSRNTRATVRGGGGANQIVFVGLRRGVKAHMGQGKATWEGGSLSFSGVYTLIGSRRKDLLIGSSLTDIIYGRAGADVIRAGAGNDLVAGQGGRDFVDGGSGGDYCYAEVRRNCEG